MAKLIDSLAFGGSSYVLSIPYAVCSTSASTAAKTVTASNWVETANLEAGARIVVKFSDSNTASSPTLNVNSTGAKSIVVSSSEITTTLYWSTGAVVEFVYDGTYWQMLGAPNNTNSTNTAHSHTAGTGLTISGSGGTSGTTTYSANLNSTTSLGTIGTTSKLYAIGVDDNGKLCVNVPWTDNNTDTKVTQAADTTATTTLPVLLGYKSGTTATTQTVNKNSAQLNFTPGATYGTLTVKGDIIAGGGSNSYGIHPATNNYSTLGKADKKWYKVYTTSIYASNYYNADGTSFSPTMTWNTF